MKIVKSLLAAGMLVSGLSGCAMLNRIDLEYHRTTTIGQELMDLQKAKERGVISDEEYFNTKKEILAGGPVIQKQKKK